MESSVIFLAPMRNEILRDQIQDFVENIADPVNRFEGNDLPVSAFEPGGRVPTGSSK